MLLRSNTSHDDGCEDCRKVGTSGKQRVAECDDAAGVEFGAGALALRRAEIVFERRGMTSRKLPW